MMVMLVAHSDLILMHVNVKHDVELIKENRQFFLDQKVLTMLFHSIFCCLLLSQDRPASSSDGQMSGYCLDQVGVDGDLLTLEKLRMFLVKERAKDHAKDMGGDPCNKKPEVEVESNVT